MHSVTKRARRTSKWSERRRRNAHLVASILYGVIAVMVAEIAVDPGELTYAEAALGSIIVGAVMSLTRFVVETVDRETEIGKRASLSDQGALLLQSLLVFVFPTLVALLIMASAMLGIAWKPLLQSVLYLGVAFVFLLGAGSSYVLDDKLGYALARGLSWTVLSLVLVIVKRFLLH